MGKVMSGRRLLEPLFLGICTAIAGVQGCGKSDAKPPVYIAGNGGVGGGRGAPAGAGARGGASEASNDGGEQDPLAPEVTLITPGELTDPNAATADNAVLVVSPVTARCKVTKSTQQGAEDVDRTSVQIEMSYGQ